MLAERLREAAERAMVADVLQKTLNAQVPPVPTISTAALPNARVPNVGIVLLCISYVNGQLPSMSMCGKAFINDTNPDDKA